MKKKFGFKVMTLAMVVTLLPFANLGSLVQAVSTGNVTSTTLKKTLSPQTISAADTTPTDGSADITQSDVPTASAFSGQSIAQPSRPDLPTKSVTNATNPSTFGYQASIAGLPNVASGQIAVIQGGSTVFNASTVSDANVQAALSWINSNGSSSNDYVLFIGGTVTLSTTTTANSGAAGSFSGLSGKAKSLTIVSAPTDSLTSSNTAAATGAATITTPTNNYFTIPTVFRNITVAGSNDNFYAQGNAFATTNGSWVTGGPNIYGGTDSTTLSVASTNIYIGSGGTGTWNIYGGDPSSNQGTISGDTHVTIAAGPNSGMTVGTLSAGNAVGGTITGNTNLSVTGSGATFSDIYGGGVGTSAAPITVGGDVINNFNVTTAGSIPSYNAIFGGAAYGTIKGAVYNTLAGNGQWAGGASYAGAGFQTNVGISTNTGIAVSNSFDCSHFTSGNTYFAGGVDSRNITGTASGKIYGNIINYARAGFNNNGYINTFSGANGTGTGNVNVSAISNISGTVDSTTASSINNTLYSTAATAVFGNVYSWAQGGIFNSASANNNWMRGGGYGYIDGDTTLDIGDASTAPGGTTTGENNVSDGSRSSSGRTGIGGAGMVTTSGAAGQSASATTSISYSSSTSAAYNTGFDIVGGGGTISSNNDYWQTGNSTTIQNNDLARWTYGSSFGGYTYGNSYNFLNGGMVDTLEGAGYNDGAVIGNSNTQVNNGQVNWFLSGGGWNTVLITGSMTTVVYNGVINAITGGNYGLGSNVTQGDSNVYVYGGDFSGSPRTGTKQLCGGNFYDGPTSIYGNSQLTLDLTGPTGSTFKFPKGNTYLSGGSGYGNSSNYTGSSASNTIGLTIKANATTATMLSSAILYGDGTTGSRTKAGTININIDADGATVGSVYATNYANGSTSNGLARNVNINVSDGVTIGGSVYGGGSSDNYTNAITKVGTNTSNVTLGDNSSGNPILISGTLGNFTSAYISKGVTVNVQGKFLNGAGATAANHAATYSTFGNLKMDDGSTLQTTGSASGTVSIGKLTVGKNCQISTPYLQTAGVINLSDLDMSNGNLFWIPTGTAVSPTTSYTGAYWGTQNGFPVLTFNGGSAATDSGATNITPGNFTGIDATNNYAFLGDYTMASGSTPTSPTWVGYVVPGQVRVYNVTGDSGSGYWQQHLAGTGISTGTPTPGTAMSAWASVDADTNATTIQVMYTMSYKPTTTNPFSFATTGDYYVKSRTASAYNGSVLNNYPTTSPNFDVNGTTTGATRSFDTSDYFTGNQQNGSQSTTNPTFGSYIIQNVVTDDTQSLNTNNIIISNSTAQSLTQTQLEQLVKMTGVGVLSDVTLPSDVLTEANAGLSSGQQELTIPITWTNGSATSSSTLVIVPDHAMIASDGQTALDAYDATLTGDEANAITSDENSNTPDEGATPPVFANGVNYYTNPMAVDAAGNVTTPTLTNASTLIPTLQTMTDSGTQTANYSYGSLSMNVTLTVNVGYLDFTQAPTNADFGTLNVSAQTVVAYPTYDKNLVVTDSRTGSQASPWQLTVAQSSPLVSGNGTSLANYLMFSDGTNSTVLSSAETIVHDETSNQVGTYTINQNWGNSSKEGVYLDVPVSAQRAGSYQGQLTWTLSETPGND
ncbi:beta strand repeat-containing protein [Lactococcus nasutitermitis]|uniref:Beta strand repeat-containing protein n=1 Tax=Lactococcus nasutitermitis TaxID=1652957 RepID=A0ABV9JCV7_9LACT|nr:hypothetical protein [Lactococcus nasutitermitis]